MKVRIETKLHSIREEKRVSQAEILQIPQSTYARIERNETLVDLERITAFATYLNIPIQELLPETLAITNNNNNSGQGGGVIFGNQYSYFGKDAAQNGLAELNQQLLERIVVLENALAKINEE